MTEKSWKIIFASSIWIGSVLGVLGFSQYAMYYFYRDNEIFYFSGSFLFLSGILILVISIIIAIATSIYFIFDKK
ncbi:MAG: hypothetical protein PHX78_00750 [bacterium]|nr:hypothetical protein [bacterium]